MKYFDIKPVCPNWREHYHIRKFIRSLDSRGYVNDSVAVLVLENKQDPCKSRIISEPIDNCITRTETVERLALSLVDFAANGYEIGIEQNKARAC